MPPQWSRLQNKLLSGLFGTFQSSAEAGQDTATVWSQLRQAAGTWANQLTGEGEQLSASELETLGSRVLSEQGITAAHVSVYRGLAGQWARAHSNLLRQAENEQITANSIFVPPWSKTAGNPAIPSRYRIRIKAAITVRGFQQMQIEEWESYELAGPLTSVADALQQVSGQFPATSCGIRATLDNIVDYHIEQI